MVKDDYLQLDQMANPPAKSKTTTYNLAKQPIHLQTQSRLQLKQSINYNRNKYSLRANQNSELKELMYILDSSNMLSDTTQRGASSTNDLK